MDGGVVVTAAGDAAVLLRFERGNTGNSIARETSSRVFAALAAIDNAAGHLPWLVDVMPAYASVLVVFDPLLTDADAVIAALATIIVDINQPAAPVTRRRIEVPVLYRPEVGPDLASLAAGKGLTVDQLVDRHVAPRYHCHMLGFRPGFPFLGGLDATLATPRLATPRTNVAAGSVAIAGQQTGIYPQSGPGGWNVIGRTPLVLFDPTRANPFLITPGDEVTFVPIDQAAFAAAGGT